MDLDATGHIPEIPDEEFIELDRRRRIKDFWKTTFIGFCTAAAAISIMFNIYLSLKIVGLANDTRSTAVSTNNFAARLIDCTTPGGKCYEQGRSATSGAVGTISKVTIAAIYCSGKLGPTATITQLNGCVTVLVK